MLDATSSSGQLGRLLAAVQTTAVREEISQPASDSAAAGRAAGNSDRIAVSKVAQAAIDAQKSAEAVTGIPFSAGATELLDVEAATSRAETGIKEMMREIGITGDLDFTISARSDGYVEVASDHPRAAEIEAAINNDPKLRNSLITVESISAVARIAEAMGKAMQAARANESGAEAYFRWVEGIVSGVEASDHAFSMSGGSLVTAFVDPSGNRYGISDGLTLTV